MLDLTNPDFELFVPGEPRPKQSFQVRTVFGKVHGYTSQKIKTWNDIIAFYAKTNFDKEPFDTPLEVNLTFYLSNKRKVDCDNLSKLVLDAMQGIVYNNDNSIIDLYIHKIINKANPGVNIQVKKKE